MSLKYARVHLVLNSFEIILIILSYGKGSPMDSLDIPNWHIRVGWLFGPTAKPHGDPRIHDLLGCATRELRELRIRRWSGGSSRSWSEKMMPWCFFWTASLHANVHAMGVKRPFTSQNPHVNFPPRSYFGRTRRHDFNRMWGRRKSSLIWQFHFRQDWCLCWSLSPAQILSGQFWKMDALQLTQQCKLRCCGQNSCKGKQPLCHGKILTWSFVAIPTSCFRKKGETKGCYLKPTSGYSWRCEILGC